MPLLTNLALITVVALAIWPSLLQATEINWAEGFNLGLTECPRDPCVAISHPVASAFLELGDLHQAGLIDSANSKLAYSYYFDLISETTPVLAVIRPKNLVELLSDPVQPDSAALLRAYSRAANLGSAEGNMRLARLFLDGVYVGKDAAKALLFAKKAQAIGHPDAGLFVSVLKIREAATEVSLSNDFAHLKSLASSGDPQAQVALGQMLLNGIPEILPADPAKAFDLFLKSASQGNETAQLNAARMQIFGVGTPSQPVIGLLKASNLADLGSIEALLLIAETYTFGVPGKLDPDPEVAFTTSLAAADQGSVTGQILAGEMLMQGQGVERNIGKGIGLLKQAANAGSIEASYKLGAYYESEEGDALHQDLATAYRYFSQAAEAGDAWASLKAASMLLEGRGIPSDAETAKRKLDALVDSGNAFAAEILAAHYEDQSEPIVAETYLERAALAGSLRAQVQIGKLRIQSHGGDGDVVTGLEYWQEAAQGGSLEAMYALGEFHASPQELVLADGPRSAYLHFQSAAEKGHAWAGLKAATMLLEGKGIDPDPEAGLRQLKGLAMGGLPEASVVLANYHSGQVGRNNRFDMEKAYAYFEHAATLGHAGAQIQVGRMLVHGSGVNRNVTKGLNILETFAAEGNAEAMLALGDIYARGHAGKLDTEAALVFYTAAAETGNVDALIRLAEIFRWGLFSTMDQKRARSYLEKAAALGSEYAVFMIGQGLARRELGAAGSMEEGVEMLKHAAESGVSEAAAVLASLGNKNGRTKCRAKIKLVQLADAAAAGNIEAGLRLVAAFRDGYDNRGCGIIRKDLKKAKVVLAGISDNLTPEELEIQDILISMKTAGRGSLTEFYSRIKALAPNTRPSAMQQVIRANPNAFVSLLQLELRERGFYGGRPNGLLTSRTIRSVSAYCRSLGAARFCRHGPFSTEVTTILFYLF